MSMSPRQYAENLLDRLISLDEQTTGAFFEMGQIMSSIEHGKLWEILGYQSFGHMITEEMSFTSGTALKYLHTYRHFKRLGYNKTEALNLIYEFSFTRVSEYLPNAKTKVGVRAVGNAIEALLKNKRQINFTVNAEQYEIVKRALEAHGASKQDSGRWDNSTEAFIDCMRAATPATKLRSVG